MSERTSTIRAREIGNQLRRYRERAGFSQRGAGQKIALSTASICRIEDGTKTPTPEDVASLLAIYGITGAARETLLAIAREAVERGWWQRHNPEFRERLNTLASLESRACTITSYQLSVMPGLLQCPPYIEALMRDGRRVPEAEIKYRVDARLARRQVLFKNDPVHFSAFVDESVLNRMPGSAGVLHRQLDYLLHVAGKPNVIIRVVPSRDSTAIAAANSFLLLRFPEAPAVVQTSNLASELYFEDQAEIALYDDVVHRLLEVALDTGESAGLITRLMRKLEEDPDVLPNIGWPPLEKKQP